MQPIFSRKKVVSKNHSLAYFCSSILFILVLGDIFLIVANWLYRSQYFINDSFSITQEWGYGEIFQYIKESSTAILLFAIFKKSKDQLFLIWGLFFAYLLIDDSFKVHEILGNVIASNLIEKGPHIFDLRGQDIGELIISGLVGSLFLVLFVKFINQSMQAVKVISYNLIVLISLLLFFGILIDMVHAAWPTIEELTIVEAGGEMIVMSLILWYMLNLYTHYPKTIFSLLNHLTLVYLELFTAYLYTLLRYLHLVPVKS